MPDASKSVWVKARPAGYWNNSGVVISAGERVTVEHRDGEWICNPGWDRGGLIGAAGSAVHTSAPPSYMLPGSPEGMLIGKIGGDHMGGGSAAFPLGSMGVVPEGSEGLLWLTVNDQRPGTGPGDGYGDNRDQILVRISTQPA
jgi:hypothetical protein